MHAFAPARSVHAQRAGSLPPASPGAVIDSNFPSVQTEPRMRCLALVMFTAAAIVSLAGCATLEDLAAIEKRQER